MRYIILCSLVLGLLSGCVGTIVEQRQRVSSGFVGCPPDEIQIISTGNYTWTAVCKDKRWFCNVGGPSASCSPETK